MKVDIKIKKRQIIGLVCLLFVFSHSMAQDLMESRPERPVRNQKDIMERNAPSFDSLEIKNLTSFAANVFFDEDGNIVDTDSLPMYVWKVDSRLGLRTLVALDTTTINFAHSTTAESKALGVQYLANIGSPLETMEYFKRSENIDFPFMNVVLPWYLNPEKNVFFDTKVPYSNIFYQSGGGGNSNESRFSALMTSNFGKNLNLGFNFDYIYSRGYYTGLFNKQVSYDIFGSYTGERYKMDFYAGNNNSNISTNGGIVNDKYITNPESEDLTSTRGNTKDIPVIFQEGVKNKLRGRYLYMTNTYDLGKFYNEVSDTDSTTVWVPKENYIAPASIVYTLDYQDQRRTFSSPSTTIDITKLDQVFVPNFKTVNSEGEIWGKYNSQFNDYMSYYSLKNTLGFRMNEGFKSWTKFGLTVFGEANLRKYLIPDDRMDFLSNVTSDNVYSIGAKLSSTKGKYLKYNFGVLKGLNKSNTELTGDVLTQFPLFGNRIGLRAMARITNTPASFFQNHFSSRNWIFNNDFDDVKKVYIGGELVFPKFSVSETVISGGYENVTNHIYIQDTAITAEPDWGEDWSQFRRTPTQYTGNVSVMSLKVKEKLKFGIFNLELQGLLQKSTNEDVIPLPSWTISANAYILTKISRVLTVQLGADSYMFSKFYARGYDPLLNQFYNQNKTNGVELGEFPFTNIYLNMHLKYTRFFIMAYNVTSGMGNRMSFTTPHYPVDPFMIRWGLSWRFNN